MEQRILRLSRLSRLTRRRLLRELEGYDTTPEQYFLMQRLQELGEAAQVQLADPLLDDRPNITRQLKSLLDRGWVSRVIDEGDRRRRVVKLTPAGANALARMKPTVDGTLEETMGGVAAADLAVLDRLLDALEPSLS